MTRLRLLLFLLLLNAISALAGGAALIWGSIKIPEIHRTGFPNLYFPGVILMSVVAGSSAVAAFAMIKRIAAWELVSLVAGMILTFWMITEMVSLKTVVWLQVIYLLIGIGIVYLTPSGNKAKPR